MHTCVRERGREGEREGRGERQSTYMVGVRDGCIIYTYLSMLPFVRQRCICYRERERASERARARARAREGGGGRNTPLGAVCVFVCACLCVCVCACVRAYLHPDP